MAIAGKLGAIYVQTDRQAVACDFIGFDANSAGVFDFTDEATTANDDYTRYNITDQAKRYWLPTYQITVKKNGSAITTGFTLEYAGGYVVFTESQLLTDVITVTGKYLTLKQAGGCFNWSLDQQTETKDVTKYETTGTWKEFAALLKEFFLSAEAYWWTDEFHDIMGNDIVVVLYVDTVNNTRYEGFAVLNQDNINASVNELIQETIGFQGRGPIYFREG